MKQYRITSDNFVHQGEAGYDDAVMDARDLAELKRLSGIPIAEDGGAIFGIAATPRATETGIMSPVGSNISITAKERNDLEREYHAQPGTELWFIINFSLPKLTGSVRDQVETYLEEHPDKRVRPRLLPGR